MSAKRIVVADDEPHIRHVLALKLEKSGFAVQTAADGQEALDLCNQELPDLLITDYQMPALNGLELCKQLRANSATSKLPVIMLTARGFALDQEEVKACGITSVMSKPFSPAEILVAVNSLLDTVAAGSHA